MSERLASGIAIEYSRRMGIPTGQGQPLTLEDARGRLLAMRVAEHIEQHPEDYDQSVWGGACGTPGCVAGWAVRLTGVTEDEFTRLVQQDEIVGAAAGVLRLDWGDATWLFDACRVAGAMPSVLRHYATTGTLDWGVEDEWLDERRRLCLWEVDEDGTLLEGLDGVEVGA